jgi:outer membrane protein assembly factor BamB
MSWVRATLAALIVLATAGCWPQPGANPAGTNFNDLESVLTVDTVGTLTERWSAPGTVSSVFGAEAYGLTNGTIRDLDLDTGAQIWSSPLPTVAGATGPFRQVAGPAVTDAGELAASYTQDTTADPSQPKVGAGLRWDRTTGELVGVLSTPPTVGALVPTRIAPVGDRILYELNDGSLQVVSTTEETPGPGLPVSTRLWAAAGVGQTGLPTLAPIVVGDTVIDTNLSTMRSFPLAGCGQDVCTPTWSVGLNPLGGVVVPSGNHLLVTHIDNTLRSYRLSDGAPEWRAPMAGSGGGLATNGAVVYAASGGTTLQAFAAEGCGAPTCTPLWSGALPATSNSNVAIAGGVVYVGTSNSQVLAFAADGCGGATMCPPIASVSTGSGFVTSVIVSNGHLVVTTDGGTPDARTVAFAPASVT